MTNFTKAQLTNEGLILAAKKGITLEFTRVETGCGIYEAGEEVLDLTSLKNKVQDMPISSLEQKNETSVAVKFVLSNKELTDSYLFTEIGIYAKDINDEEVLYAVCYALPDEAEKIRKYNGIFSSTMVISLNLRVSSSEDIVFMPEELYALRSDLEITDKNVKKQEQKLIEFEKSIINYTPGTNITFTENEDGTISINSKGGGAAIIPKPTVNPAIKNDNAKVTITWEDPTDVVLDEAVFSKWAGTKLVMKEDGYPTSPDDGTLLVDSTERDAYKTNGFEVADLVNDKVYYFALFPYSTDGVYNYDSGNRLLGEPCALKIVTFADGTDEEIAAMIQAHYDNKINIADYWAVGDKRSVNLSAMSATGVGESHRAQTVEFAIADFEKDELSTPINGHTMAAVTLTQVNCLMDATSASNSNNGSNDAERGYMNSTNTNVGGWKDCARRKWCNEVYYNALPSVFKSMVKEVNKKTSAGNQSSTINTTKDKAFLLSESEIYGSTTYSKPGEGSQYEYYKTTANRYKLPKRSSSSNSHIYWDRSPSGSDSSGFCRVSSDGSANWNGASSANGFAPCLCI